jgi:hypothetical protein
VHLRLFVLSIAAWLFSASPALAWNATGHKIIASIAFRQLSEAEQGRIVDVLKRHPRFAEDFADAMPDEVVQSDELTRREWIFQQAAVWPDLIRPPGPDAKIAFNRGQWHYINVPHFLDDDSRRELKDGQAVNLTLDPPLDASTSTEVLNIVQVIRLARKCCRDSSSDPSTRGLLLAWLFHNVGDLHQPLHSTALFSRRLFPAGDRGGNAVKTTQSFNLHSLWDQFPGRGDNLRDARGEALQLMHNSDFAAIGKRAAEQLDEQVWMNESHALAVKSVYAAEVLTALSQMEAGGEVHVIELSEGYLQAGGRVARQRLVEAGYRLGAVLKPLAAE